MRSDEAPDPTTKGASGAKRYVTVGTPFEGDVLLEMASQSVGYVGKSVNKTAKAGA